MNANYQPPARASLDLSIERGANGASRLIRHRVSYPWSLGRGYPNGDDGSVMILPQVAGAGLLAGDWIDQRIRVGMHASLNLASAGATLVHGRHGAQEATSRWTYDLAEGAQVVAAIAPNALLDNAQIRQENFVTIHPTATLVLVDGFVDASTDQSVEWSGTTTVRRPNGDTMMIDRQVAGNTLLSRHSRFPRRWTAFASLLVLVPAEKCSDLLGLVRNPSPPANPSEWVGVSKLRQSCGIGLRYATQDGASLRLAITRTLSQLKPMLPNILCDGMFWGH